MFGVFQLQPGQDRRVRAVSPTRERQRTEQIHLQPRHCPQQTQSCQLSGKTAPRQHGPHGVRTGRPNADFEQIKHAQHCRPPRPFQSSCGNALYGPRRKASGRAAFSQGGRQLRRFPAQSCRVCVLAAGSRARHSMPEGGSPVISLGCDTERGGVQCVGICSLNVRIYIK